MDISAIDAIGSIAGQGSSPTHQGASDALQQAVTAARKLNSLGIEGRQFAVERDPTTLKFVIVVRDGSGDVVDQLPPEDALKLSAQLAAATKPQEAE